jgi:hypothetical protein
MIASRLQVAEVGRVAAQGILDHDDRQLGVVPAELTQPTPGRVPFPVILALTILALDRFRGHRLVVAGHQDRFPSLDAAQGAKRITLQVLQANCAHTGVAAAQEKKASVPSVWAGFSLTRALRPPILSVERQIQTP